MSAAVTRGALLTMIALTWGCETRTPITPSVSTNSAAVAMPSAASGFYTQGHGV